MDERTEKSFLKLKSYVLSDAYNRREALTNEVENKNKNALAAEQAKLEKAARKQWDKETEKIKRENRAAVLEYELGVKKELIECRTGIINAVFDEVKEKIAEFKTTAEYEKWLKAKTQQALSACGCENALIYCALDDVEKLSEFDNVSKDDNILCGIRAENHEQGIISDFSVDYTMTEERESFLKSCGMIIET